MAGANHGGRSGASMHSFTNQVNSSADPLLSLKHLSDIGERIESLSRLLSETVKGHRILGKHQIDAVSSELATAIHQAIDNGTVLLAHIEPRSATEKGVEADAMELRAEHVHFCDICGKGFKRGANLRTHMRVHSGVYKTMEELARPQVVSGDTARFSSPLEGCNRNMSPEKFKPLNPVACMRNYVRGCRRCSKRSISMKKNCCWGSIWGCSCGGKFARKDDLFEHIAVFEGHLPEIGEGEEPMDVAGVEFDGGLEPFSERLVFGSGGCFDVSMNQFGCGFGGDTGIGTGSVVKDGGPVAVTEVDGAAVLAWRDVDAAALKTPLPGPDAYFDRVLDQFEPAESYYNFAGVFDSSCQ